MKAHDLANILLELFYEEDDVVIFNDNGGMTLDIDTIETSTPDVWGCAIGSAVIYTE